MGCYINPPDMTKEQWLEENASELPPPPDSLEKFIDKYESGKQPFYIVCLVDNGYFTAAAVAFDKDELMAFANTTDLRPKKWYVATYEALTRVCPIDHWIKNESILN